MAIAAGAEEQPQESQLPAPAPEPAESAGMPCKLYLTLVASVLTCVTNAGLQYARLDTGDVLDQESSDFGMYILLQLACTRFRIAQCGSAPRTISWCCQQRPRDMVASLLLTALILLCKWP